MDRSLLIASICSILFSEIELGFTAGLKAVSELIADYLRARKVVESTVIDVVKYIHLDFCAGIGLDVREAIVENNVDINAYENATYVVFFSMMKFF